MASLVQRCCQIGRKMASTIFCLLVIFIIKSSAAPLEKVQVNVTVHDIIETSQNGTFRYTDHGTVIIGDMELDLNRNAVIDQRYKWPQGHIYYIISPSYSPTIHNVIIAAMRELEHDVNGAGHCIQFIPRTNQANYIEIHAGTGCHSIIGYDNKGKQDVSIGQGCEFKGIIMHELMHTLGFWHEQNRSDRDNYVEIVMANVPANSRTDYTIKTTSEATNLNTAYDFDSIMHYGAYDFAADPRKPTILAKPGKGTATTFMGQRKYLSTNDVVRIQRLYGCPESTAHITKPAMITACHFQNTLCAMVTETTPNFSWTFNHGASTAGPFAGNSFGSDSYLMVHQSPNHATGVARFHTPSFNKGVICLEFFVYQKGPSSYLAVVAKGPQIVTTTVTTFQNRNHDKWQQSKTTFTVPNGLAFTLTFEAHMAAGDIAVDDVVIYQGGCL